MKEKEFLTVVALCFCFGLIGLFAGSGMERTANKHYGIQLKYNKTTDVIEYNFIEIGKDGNYFGNFQVVSNEFYFRDLESGKLKTIPIEETILHNESLFNFKKEGE